MKRCVVLLAAILLILCMGVPALASVYIGFSAQCNIRSGPGTGYTIIGTCNPGSTLPSLGDTSYDYRGIAWYKVSLNGRTGWVSSKYTYHTDQGGYTTYASGAQGSSMPSGTTISMSGSYVLADTGDCNIRSNPSTSSRVYGTLYRGQTLPFLNTVAYDNKGGAWYKVSYYGSTAWVSYLYTSVY